MCGRGDPSSIDPKWRGKKRTYEISDGLGLAGLHLRYLCTLGTLGTGPVRRGVRWVIVYLGLLAHTPLTQLSADRRHAQLEVGSLQPPGANQGRAGPREASKSTLVKFPSCSGEMGSEARSAILDVATPPSTPPHDPHKASSVGRVLAGVSHSVQYVIRYGQGPEVQIGSRGQGQAARFRSCKSTGLWLFNISLDLFY
jgi:hypothetical protein